MMSPPMAPEPTAATPLRPAAGARRPLALVTGGAGFIGSHLVDALLDRGHEVAICDDLSSGRLANVVPAIERGAALHQVDVCDATAVRRLLLDTRPGVVFHLAAQVDVQRSVADPRHDARVNVGGTSNVLAAAAEAGAARLVFCSTGGALYGNAEVVPTPEDAPIAPLSPYGHSKFAAEEHCRRYARAGHLSTVCVRHANVYGPRQDVGAEGGVVAVFADRLLSGAAPVVYGDGGQTRDFVYVQDAVEAMLRAGAASIEGSWNVGSGRETTVVELLDELRDLIGGREPATVWAPARGSEVRRSGLDASRLEAALGWRPATALAAGLRLTVESLAALRPAAAAGLP
jgi:UDP-glucose 4-epimerase